MTKKIKVAIIGYGVVGKRRKNFIIQNKKYSLEAISDVTFIKKKFQNKKITYYKNYYELLNNHNLDAVFITLPNYLASKVTIECINKKLHVFCEKPPAKSVKDIIKVSKTLLTFFRLILFSMFFS